MFKRNVKMGDGRCCRWWPSCACSSCRASMAQDYRFNLAENRVDVYINEDGTAQIVYDLTFMPDPGSHPIDVVDVGMPNSTYHLVDIRASIDGVSNSPISAIRPTSTRASRWNWGR